MSINLTGVIGLLIDDIGYNHRHEKGFVIDRPDGTADWLLLIIKSPAVYRYDSKEVRMPANVLIIYTPGAP